MSVRIRTPGSRREVVCDTVAEAIAFLQVPERRPRKAPPTEAAIADKIAAWLHRMAEKVEPTANTRRVLQDMAEGIRGGAYWPSLDETRKPAAKTA